MEVMTFPTDLDLLSLSHDTERDLDEVSQSEDYAGNLSVASSLSGFFSVYYFFWLCLLSYCFCDRVI
ncbi:hypothetical protein DPMN_144829 [Dreissena polymorpha]|uniref:Uncharacterized protein n=1 Tax=Dreissena polymorpha TaxID=45954 RepID=A0A9D4IWX7_DREPO|nr:hypothetical protein DPMN_144829 [Dreissena polymorpha]